MKKLIGWLSVSLFIPFQMLCGMAQAQTTCGPYASSSSVSLNADGITYTLASNAQCQVPDPEPTWAHTYTFHFPQTVTFLNGNTYVFVGNAIAEVTGHDDCVNHCFVQGSRRLVTVDTASVTAPDGSAVPVTKREIGTRNYPIDQWVTTAPMDADPDNSVIYSFAVTGTANHSMTDGLHIEATYHLCVAGDPAPCPPPPPPCPPEGCGE